MSNSLAIAAVTSTLRNILSAGLADMPGVVVTTLPLDQVRSDGGRPNQLNLFLYQAEPNSAFVNADPPGRARSGEVARPPLALALNYMITAYGEDDNDANTHRVLGRAMSVMHDHPVLGGAEIESALPESDLSDQTERVRTTPLPMSVDEMSKLWNAFQTQYRLSSAYRASVVLIDSSAPIRAALPVLTRGRDDSGVVAQPDLTPPFPSLSSISIPDLRVSAHVDDSLTLAGHHLDGDSAVPLLRHLRLPNTIELPAVVPTSSTSVTVDLPNDPVGLLVGMWGLALRISRAGEPERLTNEVPFALAPRISAISPNPAPRIGGGVTLTVTVAPQIRPGQPATLLLSDREVVADAFSAQVAALDFQVDNASVGDHFVRVRIDGVDSQLINRTTTPPTFDSAQQVTIT